MISFETILTKPVAQKFTVQCKQARYKFFVPLLLKLFVFLSIRTQIHSVYNSSRSRTLVILFFLARLCVNGLVPFSFLCVIMHLIS